MPDHARGAPTDWLARSGPSGECERDLQFAECAPRRTRIPLAGQRRVFSRPAHAAADDCGELTVTRLPTHVLHRNGPHVYTWTAKQPQKAISGGSPPLVVSALSETPLRTAAHRYFVQVQVKFFYFTPLRSRATMTWPTYPSPLFDLIAPFHLSTPG